MKPPKAGYEALHQVAETYFTGRQQVTVDLLTVPLDRVQLARRYGAPLGRAATVDAAQKPCRCVWGDRDILLPPRALAPAIRSALGVELQVMSDAGHLEVEEQPQYLAGLVDAVHP
ncbi:alpha/beta fold hydrolase [Streptomyces sp. Da 82-17]|uniref:alpha/beta fold hydrolase n=1 Tax=Streptomyces sp. Da 82-17 TaxID=3377116 RepID=UPI0038D3E3F0